MQCDDTAFFTGKTFLVSGGGRGLGAAICENLTAAGASIVVADVDEALAHECVERLGQRRGAGDGQGMQSSSAYAVQVDVSDPVAVASLLTTVRERSGGLHGIINNAAIDITLPIDEIETEAWRRVLMVNLFGPFLLARAAVPIMKAQGGGNIVNIASTASKRAWPNASAYHATKWGLLGLSHALHAELRPHGIKVSAIVAGGMRTPFLLDRFPDIDTDLLQDPASVARAVRFVLMQPEETVIPEVMVLPMKETSWP